jgi:protein arginine kinase
MAKRNAATDWRAALAFPGIVASCRVRLARNLHGERFPDHASEADGRRLRDSLCGTLSSLRAFRDGEVVLIEGTSAEALMDLREAHLISTEMAERGAIGAVCLAANRSLSVMVNEEDHLRIQVLRDDADLRAAWKVAGTVDRALEEKVDYAFHPTYGYLTACPSNVGTGLRVSVMLHLLGLGLSAEIDQVFKALDRLGLTVRGIWGEGSEAAGHLYQISNQQTLGETEEEIIERLDDVVAETARQEQNARMRLVESKPDTIMDCLARALAILRSARILRSDETLDFLSALRMGVEAGLVLDLEPEVVDYWMKAILPGHMQTLAKGVLESDARDRIRAELMRQAMAEVRLAE